MKSVLLVFFIILMHSCSDKYYSQKLESIHFNATIHVDGVPAADARLVIVVTRFIDSYTGFVECQTNEDGELSKALPASKNLSVISIDKITHSGVEYFIDYKVCNVRNGDLVELKVDLLNFN